jgi:dimethylaniline monooxygenase (N-oxide forming)
MFVAGRPKGDVDRSGLMLTRSSRSAGDVRRFGAYQPVSKHSTGKESTCQPHTMTQVVAEPGPASRVVVVGLGSCGLVTLKNLLEVGFDAIGFDRNNYVGGLWKFSPENKTTVLKTTVANLSKQLGGYTDFAFPDHGDNFPTADQFGQYLEDYAKAFDLLDRVKLGRAVEKVTRSKGNDGWEVKFKQDGREHIETFDKVVLCHGLQVYEPIIPRIDGIGTFTGRAIHSNEYKGPEPFKEMKVVIVGMGNTGPDIACDLVGHASKVYLSHRNGHAIVSMIILRFDPGTKEIVNK